MKGFKSFASATTLSLEPGITCVVGPNGAGKSNVVDALTWVMGEQGATSLRGGKMEDVIFAGTAHRAPLGRAEVTLRIDNSDGALPIEYSEVTISRTMFRSGGSEYAINGQTARLLDVQELLSDSGLGRQMHVIVGQGQLDTVLRAAPADRRGFIEEAAGVLKHRRRKEKAIRKLDAMQANLTRLEDLTSEIRRQLAPLGRQAQTARRAAAIQADYRDARARLLADELAQLTATLQAEVADEAALLARRKAVQEELAELRHFVETAEQESRADDQVFRAAQDLHYAYSALAERLRGVAALAGERQRSLGVVDAGEPDPGAFPDQPGSSPEELRRQASAVRVSEAELSGQLEAANAALATAVRARGVAESLLAQQERRVAALARAAADRREGLARLTGQVAAARSQVEAAHAEAGRLHEVLVDARARADLAGQEFVALENRVAGVEADEHGLDSEYEQAQAAAHANQQEVDSLNDALRAADQDKATWTARGEALQMGLTRSGGAQALLAATAELPGLIGPVATLLGVENGFAEAIAAALGDAADAIAVDSVATVVDALRLLKDADAGQASFLVGAREDSADDSTGDEASQQVPVSLPASGLPPGVRPAAELVRAPRSVAAAAAAVLRHVVIVEGLAQARDVVQARSDLVAVTRDGDVIGPTTAHGGSGSAPSVLQVQAAVDEATARAQQAAHRGEQARFARAGAAMRLSEATQRVSAALDRLHESDAQHAAVAERLGQLASSARSAKAEADRLEQRLEEARGELGAAQGRLDELSQRLAAAEQQMPHGDEVTGGDQASRGGPAPEGEPATGDELADRARAARTAETDARLALRTVEERLRGIAGRAESLERAAAAQEQARRVAQERARQRARHAEVAAAVLADTEIALAATEVRLAMAARARDEADDVRSARHEQVSVSRRRHEELAGELAKLTDTVHRDEVARAQQRLRIEVLESKAIEELGLQPTALTDEFGPHLMVPAQPLSLAESTPEEPRESTPFVRDEQLKRCRRAERQLSQLGKVNPLALEEFAALEERHTFLSTQLEDLRQSRADLSDIIAEVDARVQQVFAQAYADTAREFELVFARLFPGGRGTLELTDPHDMLTTGVEVNASPAGKRIKRLSLLSGGERALTAVALLIAIFRARPSPFYVLDEVEAALDEVNLGRLLGILAELRETSQLIVITHQRRTMQIADALYGVTMREDGVSAVISQRLRERVDA